MTSNPYVSLWTSEEVGHDERVERVRSGFSYILWVIADLYTHHGCLFN